MSTFTFFYLIRSRHLERMTRIEHGMDEPDPFAFRQSLINTGIFLCSLGLGLFVSYLGAQFLQLPDHIVIPGCLLLFGGLSLILIAFLDRRAKN
ncbi:MAG: DUF6249 domain-containing protein [Saprospiraceae bacterium]